MKRLLDVLHPFFIALSPVLFLYAYNVEQVLVGDTLISALIVLALAIIVLGLFSAIFRDLRKGALAASFFLILFFSYGHLFALKELYSIRLRYLIGGAVLLFSLGLFFIATTRRDLRVLARSATVFAVFLILFSVLQITVFKIKSAYFSSRYGSSDNIKVVGNGGGPDIYYIMLDGYASSWSLREVYKYDNTPFLNALRDRGFFVVSKSRSNYPNTTFSLPSMLNMDYVENLTSDGLFTKVSRLGPSTSSFSIRGGSNMTGFIISLINYAIYQGAPSQHLLLSILICLPMCLTRTEVFLYSSRAMIRGLKACLKNILNRLRFSIERC